MMLREKKKISFDQLVKNHSKIAEQVSDGYSFVITVKNKPSMYLSPFSSMKEENEQWESVINFEEFKKGGVPIQDVIAAFERLS